MVYFTLYDGHVDTGGKGRVGRIGRLGLTSIH